MNIEAFILAGGGSVRFGADKALAEIDRKPLILHVFEELSTRYQRVRVVSAPGRNYANLGLEAVFDARPDAGPLAGIEAALDHASSDLVAIAPCDVFGLRADWYGAVEAAAGHGAAALFDDRWHPLVGVYHKDIMPVVRRRLDDGVGAVRALLDEVGTRVALPKGFDEMRSINRKEDLP